MEHYSSKMKRWRLLLSFVIIVLTSSFAPESGSTSKKKSAYEHSPADWTLIAQKDGVEVSYKSEQCTEGQRILFLIRNNTLASQDVAFACTITVDGNDIVFPSIVNSVEGNGSLEGSCTDLAYQSTFIALQNGSTLEAIVLTIQ